MPLLVNQELAIIPRYRHGHACFVTVKTGLVFHQVPHGVCIWTVDIDPLQDDEATAAAFQLADHKLMDGIIFGQLLVQKLGARSANKREGQPLQTRTEFSQIFKLLRSKASFRCSVHHNRTLSSQYRQRQTQPGVALQQSRQEWDLREEAYDLLFHKEVRNKVVQAGSTAWQDWSLPTEAELHKHRLEEMLKSGVLAFSRFRDLLTHLANGLLEVCLLVLAEASRSFFLKVLGLLLHAQPPIDEEAVVDGSIVHCCAHHS